MHRGAGRGRPDVHSPLALFLTFDIVWVFGFPFFVCLFVCLFGLGFGRLVGILPGGTASSWSGGRRRGLAATQGTLPRQHNISFVRSLGAGVLLAAVDRRAKVVRAGVDTRGVDVVVFCKVAHGDDERRGETGVKREWEAQMR